MTLLVPKLSKELSSVLYHNEKIGKNTQLHEALAVVAEDHSEYEYEITTLLESYGPDTTVGDLRLMATVEEPQPYTMKDFLGWLKFWA